MKKLPFVAAGALAIPFAALVACGTDNGENVYGQQFGPPPTRPDGAGVEAADDGGPVPQTDGGQDGEAGPCAEPGTIAVLAGNDTSLTASIQIDGGAWSGAAIPGAAAKGLPALVKHGAGFLGVTAGVGDALQSVVYTTSWSAPASVGVANVKLSPSLAVVGAKAHVVYVAGAGANRDFYHGIYDASWDAASDPVGSPQSFGNSAAALAAAGTDLAFAQAGSDNGLYVRTWNGAWSSAAGVNGAGADEVAAPAFAAVDGKYDLVLVYARNDTKKVEWTARDATTKAFTPPALVNASPTTYAATIKPISLVRVGQFTLLMTFMGTDDKGYYVSGTLGATSIAWSSPAPIVAGGVTVDSTPRAAKGVCGDDGIFVYASAGQVRAVRLRGSSLSAPEPVAGASGSRVSVASR
ncbi:MAG: hypothetical protein KF819_08965 [Labilithrix sp.]|nr:hypothetical protein [Labilithrix sp.]